MVLKGAFDEITSRSHETSSAAADSVLDILIQGTSGKVHAESLAPPPSPPPPPPSPPSACGVQLRRTFRRPASLPSSASFCGARYPTARPTLTPSGQSRSRLVSLLYPFGLHEQPWRTVCRGPRPTRSDGDTAQSARRRRCWARSGRCRLWSPPRDHSLRPWPRTSWRCCFLTSPPSAYTPRTRSAPGPKVAPPSPKMLVPRLPIFGCLAGCRMFPANGNKNPSPDPSALSVRNTPLASHGSHGSFARHYTALDASAGLPAFPRRCEPADGFFPKPAAVAELIAAVLSTSAPRSMSLRPGGGTHSDGGRSGCGAAPPCPPLPGP